MSAYVKFVKILGECCGCFRAWCPCICCCFFQYPY